MSNPKQSLSPVKVKFQEEKKPTNEHSLEWEVKNFTRYLKCIELEHLRMYTLKDKFRNMFELKKKKKCIKDTEK